MLDNESVENLEKKYFNVLFDLFSKHLGKILTQISSQKLYENLTATQKTNLIDHSVENILEQIISSNLNWPIGSLPVSSDSCYECGDAVIHLDAKTVLVTDGDYTNRKINVEGSQTTFVTEEPILINNALWKPKLKYYEEHAYFGEIPNLTYILKVGYDNNFVHELSLVCLPHGQLKDRFVSNGKYPLLTSGKSKSRTNIRFLIDEILKVDDWRQKQLFKLAGKNKHIQKPKKTAKKKKAAPIDNEGSNEE